MAIMVLLELGSCLAGNLSGYLDGFINGMDSIGSNAGKK